MARARVRRAERRVAPRSRSALIGLAAIVLATIAVYSPAIKAPFQFDDIAAIVTNPTIERLQPMSIPLTPPPRTAVSGRPVSNYSFALSYALDQRFGSTNGRDSTVAYHVLNILIHVLCGVLLFAIVRRSCRAVAVESLAPLTANDIALAVAALWLLHPIQTEAVDYIVQRTELLVSLSWLATLYAAIGSWDAASNRRRNAWYVASVAACLVGMGSKEVMVGAPIIVVLYDRAFRARSWRELFVGPARRTWFYAALAATWLWLAALISSGGRADSVGFGLGLSWYRYLWSQAWAIGHYVRLLVVPIGLTYDYGQRPVAVLSAIPGAVLVALALAMTILAWTRDRWRHLAFVGAWFFLLLGPSSSVIPIRTEIAAERRVYLASAAVVLLFVLVVAAALGRFAARDETRAPAVIRGARVLFGALCLVLAVATYRRSQIYNDPEALWRGAMNAVPSNARAYDNLTAVVLHKTPPDTAQAVALMQRAIEVDSMYLLAWTNLAAIELEQGHVAAAKARLERVLAIDPGFVDANERLGGLLVRTGDYGRAIPLLERMAARYPTEEGLVALAVADMATGRQELAAVALRRALEINPRRSDAVHYLGVLLLELHRPAEAIPYLEATAVATPSAATLSLLSLSYAQTGKRTEALQAASAAGARQPDASACIALGRAMLLIERPKDAIDYFSEAVRLAPRDPEAITRLGVATATAGDVPGAERLYRRALTMQPNYPPALQALELLRGAPRE